jgi:2-polyprenyl-3-methyl-5-hydroxy-6-metoxy-1,4-benzoquinol methylase
MRKIAEPMRSLVKWLRGLTARQAVALVVALALGAGVIVAAAAERESLAVALLALLVALTLVAILQVQRRLGQGMEAFGGLRAQEARRHLEIRKEVERMLAEIQRLSARTEMPQQELAAVGQPAPPSVPSDSRREGGTAPRPAPESLKAQVREFMERRGGTLYSPIPHPDFADWPAARQYERFEVIEPHLDFRGGTALDIGTHFGTFAHWLEDLGYTVTAVEKSSDYASVAREVRDLCGKKFTVVEGTIFDLEETRFDVVLALNIFHHFLKTKDTFEELETFLDRLECKMMIFQAADPEEKALANAYRRMDQDEVAEFVGERTGLARIKHIGDERGRRKIFKLARPA